METLKTEIEFWTNTKNISATRWMDSLAGDNDMLTACLWDDYQRDAAELAELEARYQAALAAL